MPNQTPYGFHRLADRRDRLVTEVGVELVDAQVRQSFEEHTRNLNQTMGNLVTFTEEYKTLYKTAQNARLQPGDEDSRGRKIKAQARYEVGFPLRHYNAAWGANFVTLEKMTVSDVADNVAMLQDADRRTVRDAILIAFFDATGYTFADDERGNLAVKPLANGDAVLYNVETGADAGVSDSHFLFPATAIDLTLAAFQAIYTELTEHPENGETVTVWVPTNQRGIVEGLTGFTPVSDANLRQGANATILTGSDGLSGPGELFGYIGKCFVREWRQLPTNYSIALAPGGAKPLAFRQEPQDSLKGFRKAREREDYPFWEAQYFRRFGIGAFNRVGGLVFRSNATSYAVPTGFGLANLG